MIVKFFVLSLLVVIPSHSSDWFKDKFVNWWWGGAASTQTLVQETPLNQVVFLEEPLDTVTGALSNNASYRLNQEECISQDAGALSHAEKKSVQKSMESSKKEIAHGPLCQSFRLVKMVKERIRYLATHDSSQDISLSSLPPKVREDYLKTGILKRD